jgi:hypothetical protein
MVYLKPIDTPLVGLVTLVPILIYSPYYLLFFTKIIKPFGIILPSII